MLIRTFASFSLFALSLTPLYAGKGYEVTSSFPNDSALQYLAPAGEVRQGEVVAVLDCTEVARRLKTQAEQIAMVEQQLKQWREKLEVTKAINQEKLENAAEALVAAERDVAKYQENDAPGTEVALKLALHDAESEFKKQEERYASRDKLLEEGFIHKVEYDNEETRLKRTQLALEAARLKMTAFQKYEREAREALLAQALKRARDEKAAMEKETAKALEQAEAQLVATTELLRSLGEQREALTRKLNLTIIRAAKAGTFKRPPSLSPGDPITPQQLLGHIH